MKYQIISKMEFNGDGIIAICVGTDTLWVGEMLVDENGRSYRIKAFGLINFKNASDTIQIRQVLLSGDMGNLGRMLSPYEAKRC